MEQQPKQEAKKKSVLKIVIILTVLSAAGYFAYQKISYALAHETTDNAQVETLITPVLPRVSGYVKHIAVADYDSVSTGQLLVELDDAEMQVQLIQMQADLKVAEAEILNANAAINNSALALNVNTGNTSLAMIKRNQAAEEYTRNKNLFEDQAITKKQLNESIYALNQAEQQLANSRTEYTVSDSRIPVLKASRQKAEAGLEMKRAAIELQKLKISYTKIYAPQVGKIGKKNISEGQFVQSGTPLFSIVSDSTYWIIANFKETQIRKFHPGMKVDITLDAYPDEKIDGTIESLSDATGAKFSLLPPDNSSGNFVKVTQRVPVKIIINGTKKYKDLLRAGLSAYISVPVK